MSELSTDHRDLAERVHTVLVRDSVDARVDGDLGDERIASAVRAAAPLATPDELRAIVQVVRQRLRGLGPLTPLLADPHVTDVMINGSGAVWIERGGRLAATDVDIDADGVRLLIDRIVGPLGLRLDRAVPFVDARLDDGSRVHIVVPPLAIDGPCVTIRRFSSEPLPLERFTSPQVAHIVADAVARRANVVVSGGTGSGKTSLLNAMASLVPEHERLITLEDAAELRLRPTNVVRLEARPPNAEGVGEVTMRSLVRNALRMRPDRLIVGEVRGAEAFDMVQAMNTGHHGSMSTCHANSAPDALHRIEAMVAMSEARPSLDVVRSQLRSAIDVVIHLVRAGPDRRIDQIVATSTDAMVTLVEGGQATADAVRWRRV